MTSGLDGRQRAGVGAIEAALDGGEPVTQLLVARDTERADVLALCERARTAGIPVRPASAGDLRRLSQTDPPEEVLALLERQPDATAEAVFERGGATWLLVGAAYPGNVGAVLRTVEVAGAEAAFVDAELDRAGRRAALRTSMNAERFMPVFWRGAEEVIGLARGAGHAVLAIEDVGDAAPWQLDLTRPTLFLAGGEDASLPPDLLARCDRVLRLPMRGFIPCYNLQAAVAAVAGERLRQLETGAP